MSSYKSEAMASRKEKLSKMDCFAGGGSVQPITPQVADNFTRAVRNAGSDEEMSRLQRVAKDRYGVDLK